MKAMVKLFLVLGAMLNASQSWADPRIDFYPTALKFQTFHPDEFSDQVAQRVLIYATNGGNVLGGVRDLLSATVKGRSFRGYYYGPNGSLGYATNPGETGHISLQLPNGTIRHCEKVRVTIDTTHRLQYGTGVFGNDTKDLVAYEIGNNRPCIQLKYPPKLPDPRLPRLPQLP